MYLKMTSKPKVYQNYRFDELIEFSKHNPHRSRQLSPIGILSVGTRKDGTGEELKKGSGSSMAGLGLDGYTLVDLQPTGLLSMIICIEDPHAYSLSTPSVRSQQLSECCTRLQQRTDELKNSTLSRKRKRVYELLGSVYNESTVLEEKDYCDLFHAMEYFEEVHFIRMNRAIQHEMESDQKEQINTISFSYSPLLWKRDRPIWIVDAHCRWIAIPTDTLQSLHAKVGDWLTECSEKGWKIEWPEIDGNKTELMEQLISLGSWQETDKKFTKDILAQRLGKEKTIHLFQKWKSQT